MSSLNRSLRPAHRSLRRGDDRGAVAVLSAVALVVLIGAAALAVDLGRLAWDRRDLQGVADAAALDAVQAFGERPGQDYQTLAATSAARNGYDGDVTATALVRDGGAYRAPSGDERPEAVEVTVSRDIDYLFAFFAPDGGTNTVSGVAAVEEVGGVEIGTRLASVDSGESAILGLLLDPAGGAVDASLLDHTQGVAGAGVELGALFTELGLGALTPQEALASEVSLVEVLDAAAVVADGDAVAHLQALAGLVDSGVDGHQFALGDILALGAPGSQAALESELDALSLARAAAMAAHASSGQSLALEAVVPNVLADESDLDTDENGQVDANLVSAELWITEPPQIAIGPAEQVDGEWVTSARTAQIELDVSVAVAGLFDGQQLTLDLSLAGGKGQADLTDVRCGETGDELEVDVTTALVDAEIGASLSDGLLGLLTVSVDSGLPSPVAGSDTLTFGPEFGPDSPTQQVAGQWDLGGSVEGLFSNTSVTVDILGTGALDTLLDNYLGELLTNLLDGLLGIIGGLLGGGLDEGDVEDAEGTLEGILGGLVGSALETLETELLSPLFDGLGIDLAEADVRGLHHECGQRALVR